MLRRQSGKLKDRTYPVMGNHELSQDRTATPYYDYFNGVGVDSGRAGKRGKAYYSVDAAGWRIYIANFNAYNQPLDEQEAWMKQDLAANPHLCTMAVWHRPLFVSSDQPSGVHKASKVPHWWNTLYAGGLDVILNGHSHLYERFGKLRSDGVVDSARGIRKIIAGTGAAGLYKFNTILPGSQKRILSNGVLKMTLRPSSYSWAFLDMKAVVKDSGSDTCTDDGVSLPVRGGEIKRAGGPRRRASSTRPRPARPPPRPPGWRARPARSRRRRRRRPASA